MSNLGFYVIPLMILIIITLGFLKKINVFDAFLSGAGEGAKSCMGLIPSLVGLIVAVSMLKSSGAFDIFTHAVSPIFKFLGLPAEVVPMALLRPVSGSGSIAILDNILKTHGPDSFIGRLASIMSGSTETTFYTLAVYFGAVKIKDSKYAVPCAVMADVASVIMSLITLKYFFS